MKLNNSKLISRKELIIYLQSMELDNPLIKINFNKFYKRKCKSLVDTRNNKIFFKKVNLTKHFQINLH